VGWSMEPGIGLAIFLISFHTIKNNNDRRYSMKQEKTQLKIHCIFSEDGECIENLILQSLRNFIKINLQKDSRSLT